MNDNNNTEYLKSIKAQAEDNAKSMSNIARQVAFAIIGFSITIYSHTQNPGLTYLFLIFVIAFFIVDFIQSSFLWIKSKKIFNDIKYKKKNILYVDKIDSKNKKVALKISYVKYTFLFASLIIMGVVVFKIFYQ